uniref:Putative intracellular 3-hydroxybutyrate-oligomer hydrolase n=1 Tax=Ralstonia pickettii TaxID=329 RepID=B1Q2M6_RALPI|nr:putative intracellular 3-hydroxybutyrate-oligomer hydrolase [Ralstonia pickettii]
MSASPRLGFVQCISPSGLHRMAYHEWGGRRQSARFGLRAWTDPHRTRFRCAGPGPVRRLPGGLSRRGGTRPFRLAGRPAWLCAAAVRGRHGDADRAPERRAGRLVRHFDGRADRHGAGRLAEVAGTQAAAQRRRPRAWPSAIERIGAYLRLPVRFKTFEEGLAYLQTISASFGRHTPEQWRELNGAILKPLQGAQGLEWGLHYDPSLAVPFRETTPEMVQAGEAALWRAFEAIQAPLLVVRGAQSDLLLRDTVAEMEARGRQVSAVEVPDVGHAPTFIDPAQIAVARAFFLA